MDHGTRDELHRSRRPAFPESSEQTTDDDSATGVGPLEGEGGETVSS
jgi:hypothetical protein